ncbi:hypothetical protein DM02DRAFT_653050 [Periconia macrospinosa]|uniref:Uncharacterized protein n=1 Tax=Periconia macrospinosa TaxID=97972 RepID=A0A2V1DXI5_9PLEO|nr:hypothetical protein DM02DRAFT_653050 [Periconia macrospinosa]
MFYASTKMVTDDAFISDVFLSPRSDITSWKPACTHLSLSESVRADLGLTAEQLIVAHQYRLNRGRAKTERYRKRKRRVNEIAASVRAKAKELQRFRCEVCDHNAAIQLAFDYHLQTAAHAEAVKNGGKVVKPLSAAALSRRASRAAALESREYYCAPCDTFLVGINVGRYIPASPRPRLLDF